MKRYALTILTILLLLPSALLACPMCKDSIGNSDAQAAIGLPGGFNVSVYLMLIGFLTCVGMASFVITKGVMGANAKMANDQTRMTKE